MSKLKQLLGESKKYIVVAIVAILVYEFFENLSGVMTAIAYVLRAARAIILGLVLAYIANIPTNFFMGKPLRKIKSEKLRGALAMTLGMLVILAIVVLLLVLLIPTFTDSVIKFATELPNYIKGFNTWFNGILVSSDANPTIAQLISGAWNTIVEGVSGISASVLPSVITFTLDFFTMLFDIIMGIIVAIFALANKSRLVSIFKRMTNAFLSKKHARFVLNTAHSSNDIFRKYISGQFITMLILMLSIYVMMKVFNMPYPEMISVIVAFASLVPVLGAWVGTIVCAFFVLLVDPMMALWFVIGAAVVQQLIGSFVYPHVVGNAVGLTGFFVTIAVLLFGGLFGVIGMLAGVPLLAIVYLLLKNAVKRREESALKG